jgi:hypothetical protein
MFSASILPDSFAFRFLEGRTAAWSDSVSAAAAARTDPIDRKKKRRASGSTWVSKEDCRPKAAPTATATSHCQEEPRECRLPSLFAVHRSTTPAPRATEQGCYSLPCLILTFM